VLGLDSLCLLYFVVVLLLDLLLHAVTTAFVATEVLICFVYFDVAATVFVAIKSCKILDLHSV